MLVKALEITIVMGEKGDSEELPSTEEILGWIAGRLHMASQIDYLVQSSKAWKVLKNGALARALGVKDEKVKQLAETILETFKERFERGPQNGSES